MKNKFFKLFVVSVLLGGIFVSCEQVSSSNSTPNGEEEWSGNWTKSDWSQTDEPTIKHECSKQCLICGKCLDLECQEEACKEKCFDLTNRTKYTYSAANKKVKLVAGSKGDIFRVPNDTDGGYVDNFNNNKDCEIVYSITSEKENTVCLGATISRMPDPTSITNTTEFYMLMVNKSFLKV